MIRFQALGGLTITERGEEVGIGGPRQRRLLAMLLIHRNAVVSVDRLADAVFAGDPTPAASTTLRSYVARIRKVIETAGSTSNVMTQAPGYVLRVPSDAFDVARFEGMVSDARSRLARDDAAGIPALLREALGLWRGNAYAEFDEEDWARPEAQRLGELRLVAHETLFDAELACGRASELIPELESLATEHSLREAFRAQLMIALYRAGRQADALRAFGEYRRVLVEELGLDPTPALQDLERRILSHDPTLMLTQPSGLPLRGYRLGERLGTGRDGTVYAAELPGVQREYVIRVIRQDIADRAEFVRSFEAIAHRAASLRHPAVVAVHDYWREPGAAYVVMRRMHGGSLADRLTRGPLTCPEAAALVRRVGGALVAAADAGIVHGRLTPSNVLFDDMCEACLTDFELVPSDRPATLCDDVHDLAVMLRGCIANHAGGADEVLKQSMSTVGRPSMAEFVAMLVGALTGGSDRGDGALPNPYKGLRAFDEADAADFFGRAELIDGIVERLGHDDVSGRLVLIVAGSGTGKSSVVRAGLLPRVRSGDVRGSREWFITTMLPGGSPFKELAESLRRVAVADTPNLADELAADGGIDRVVRRLIPDDGQLLLIVDQFEELFTLASDRDQRAYLDGLMHAVSTPDSRLRVVATLRADFYDRPLAFQRFGSAVNEATVTIAGMSPADLEAAIVEPAVRVGREVELPLVAELVSAVADEPAALPSLQFTLYELAESCPDTLTLAAYRALGGVHGAIASRAELLYRSLDDDERTSIRQLFEQLVVVGIEGEPTRRRAARTDLTGVPVDPAIETAIDRWTNARLLSVDRHPQTRVPTVEVAHEALLREWPRLRRWIDEDRDALVVLGHLREAAASWSELERDPGALYRGARLQVALDVADGRSDALPSVQREFVDASREARDLQEREESERVSRQARANRRLRIQLVAIAAALVVALVVGFIAVDQRGKAEQERRVATARELTAASGASLADDPERSMLLAMAAIDTTRGSGGSVLPEAVAALHSAVTSSRIVRSFPDLGGALDWSPDGTVFITEGPEESGLVDIRDAETGESVRSWHGHDVDINDVTFNNDGSMLATTGDDGAMRVWDVATGEELASFEYDAGGYGVNAVSFSPDGSRVAASWLDQNVVRVFDIASGDTISEFESEWALGTSFSADGERLAFGNSNHPELFVADIDAGTVLFRIETGAEGMRRLEFSPEGRRIASTGRIAQVWDANTGEHLYSAAAHGPVNDVDWSSDGTHLATVSDDGTARVSEITDDGLLDRFVLSGKDTGNGLQGVAFSPDAQRIMTTDWAMAAVKIWDVSATGGAELMTVAGTPNVLGAAAFVDADGDRVVVRSGETTASVWDVESSGRVRDLGVERRGEGGIMRLDVSPDGRSVAINMYGALLTEVWDTATNERLFTVADDPDVGIFDVAWSNDGELLAVSEGRGATGAVAIFDRSGAEIAQIPEEEQVLISSVAFSADGHLVAWTRKPARDDPAKQAVRIWDLEQGASVGTIKTNANRVEFDPTGRWIVSLRMIEGVADIWDASSLEEVATLAGPAIYSDITFNADGSRVATAGADGVVRLWDPETGVQQSALSGHATAVRSVEFSPDGTRLVSMGDDGLVRVWALDLDDLIEIATSRLTRTLSDDECRQYLHLERCPGSAATFSG